MLIAHLVSSMAARRQMFMDTETSNSGWHEGHATFYGDMTCAETMQGACGYGDLFKQGKGGVRFHIKGNPWWTMVLLYNVGGAGDIMDVKIKGSSTKFWWPMVRSWGMNWQTGVVLVGQSLSFQVTTSDGKMIEFDNVAPADWKFLQIFDGELNF
ncbi:hypothetical protein V6N13_089383 [Hibiscus sabdariffa]